MVKLVKTEELGEKPAPTATVPKVNLRQTAKGWNRILHFNRSAVEHKG